MCKSRHFKICELIKDACTLYVEYAALYACTSRCAGIWMEVSDLWSLSFVFVHFIFFKSYFRSPDVITVILWGIRLPGCRRPRGGGSLQPSLSRPAHADCTVPIGSGAPPQTMRSSNVETYLSPRRPNYPHGDPRVSHVVTRRVEHSRSFSVVATERRGPSSHLVKKNTPVFRL